MEALASLTRVEPRVFLGGLPRLPRPGKGLGEVMGDKPGALSSSEFFWV